MYEVGGVLTITAMIRAISLVVVVVVVILFSAAVEVIVC